MEKKQQIIAIMKKKYIPNNGLFVRSRGNDFFGFDYNEQTKNWDVTLYDCCRTPIHAHISFDDEMTMMDYLQTL